MVENVCAECGYSGEPSDDGLCPECGQFMLDQETLALIAVADAAGRDENDEAIVLGKGAAMEGATEQEKAAQRRRAAKYGIEIRKDGNVTKPAAYRDVDDSDFADPVNYMYPMNTYDRAVAALRYWGKPANRAKYSPKSQAIITKRMKQLAKKQGVKSVQTKDTAPGSEWGDMVRQLEQVNDLDAAEDLLVAAQSLPDSEEQSQFLHEARAKIAAIAADGRTLLRDEFTGRVQLLEHEDKTTFRAIVAQVDTVNKNGRLYPRKEIVKNLPRVNKLAQAGSMVGLDGHPPWLGGDAARSVAVKYTKFMLSGKDLYAEGEIVPTSAGREVATCWEAGVGLEWSMRGYGNEKPVTDDKGRHLYSMVEDYVLDGVDIVLRGAAETKTLKVQHSQLGQPPEGNTMESKDTDIILDSTAKPEDPIQTSGTSETPVQTSAAPVTPAVDVAAVTKSVTDAATAAAAEATKAVLAEERLRAYKAAKLEGIEGDIRKPLERALALADSIEAVDEQMAEFEPLLKRALEGEKYAGVGFVLERTAMRQRREKWYLGGQLVDRPETPAQAKAQLIESVPDNGKRHWDNPRAIWTALLDNLESNYPEYFEAVTRRGIMETPTGTSALGTTMPQVLPLLRQLFPMLIPYELASVQPLDRPTGRVYTITFRKDSPTGDDLSDSSTFDSTWADHAEAATKSQISFSISGIDVTTKEKSIYYDVTSTLIQDLRAVHDLDAEAELLDAAASEIAREINAEFLEMLRAGATAGNVTYGGANYAALNYTGQEWNDRLIAFFSRASGLIFEKVYVQPDWIVVGPNFAPLIKNIRGYTSDATRQFGTGLRLVGRVSDWTVYEAAWLSNPYVAIVGYRPPEWANSAAVYAPYIPLYISPQDYDAAKNLAKRSVTSRYAMAVLRGNGLATVTYAPSTNAAEPFA